MLQFFFCRILHTMLSHLRAHASARSVTVARSSAYRSRLVGDRRGGGPSSVAPRSRSPPPAEPVLAISSRQRLGHLQSYVDGGWHVCQAVFPDPQSAAARRRVERRDCAHEALPRLQSASSWSVMEQLVSGVCRLSCTFHAAGYSPPYVRRDDTGQ